MSHDFQSSVSVNCLYGQKLSGTVAPLYVEAEVTLGFQCIDVFQYFGDNPKAFKVLKHKSQAVSVSAVSCNKQMEILILICLTGYCGNYLVDILNMITAKRC